MNIEELEQVQNKYKKYKKLGTLFGIIFFATLLVGGLITSLISIYSSETISNICLIITCIATAILFIISAIYEVNAFKLKKELDKTYNKNIVAPTLQQSLNQYFSDYTFNPEMGIDKEFFINNGIMYASKGYKSNNYIRTTYKKLDVTLAQIYNYENINNQDLTDVFDGIWLVINNKDNLKYDIQIGNKIELKKLLYQNLFPINSVNNYSDLKPFHHFNELGKLGNNIKIYGNERDAFDHLNYSLVNKLLELTNEQIIVTVKDNQIHLGLHINLFNMTSPTNELNVNNEVNKNMNEFKIIIDILDEISNNDFFI